MDINGLKINEQGYFDMPGLSVLVYNNTFPDGKQGGVEIIQHDDRVASCGELRLDVAPGQWQPVPRLGDDEAAVSCSPVDMELGNRRSDPERGEISMYCRYPDESRHLTGFNPMIYPAIEIGYRVRVTAGTGSSFTIAIDLDEPLSETQAGKAGYVLELFPGHLFGRGWAMADADGRIATGLFPRQPEGPTVCNADGDLDPAPLAVGRSLTVTPECEHTRLSIHAEAGGDLRLYDGRVKHNNGWFVVYAEVPAGVTKDAIVWTVTPHVIPGWVRRPAIHISQIGYHPQERKKAYIELDNRVTSPTEITLTRIDPDGTETVVRTGVPTMWGRYLRYHYATFDFTDVAQPGFYRIGYGDIRTHVFRVAEDVYTHHIWQPTLEYFLPTQMCHMRVNQKYRCWHDICHMDDAHLAPPSIAHFDGYETVRPQHEVPFQPMERVPGFAQGGWHDAGDFDVRTDTQVRTILPLVYAWEEFGLDLDETMVDQEHHHVEIHQPDGKPDVLQQIEHGVLWLLAGYRAFRYIANGVICPTLRQYTFLGEPGSHTDNVVFDEKDGLAKLASIDGLWYKRFANRYSAAYDPAMEQNRVETLVPDFDDRLLFVAENPGRQLAGAAGLAAAARALTDYDSALSAECLKAAEDLYRLYHEIEAEDVRAGVSRIQCLAELIRTTRKQSYIDDLLRLRAEVVRHFPQAGWSLARVMPLVRDAGFEAAVEAAAFALRADQETRFGESPFSAPLSRVEQIGMHNWFLWQGWPEIFDEKPVIAILQYMLGCHPGSSLDSMISGIGAHSPTIAYGYNRADWSYVPGGTFWNSINLIRPDFPEDKVWPFLWQEREYITDASTMYLFLAAAVQRYFEEL